MVDDTASDSDSTSTTNDSEASDKCEIPLIAPGNTDTQIVDDITYAECLKLSQKIDEASRIIDETIQKCQSDMLRLKESLSKSY